MKRIIITNPDGLRVRINIAHIISYSAYNYMGMLGTRIEVSQCDDNVKFAQQTTEEIDEMINNLK